MSELKEYHRGCGLCVLCHDCLVEVWPTWFWWKDVPMEYRATYEYCKMFLRAESRIRRMNNALKPNRCLAAVLDFADYRKWIPCGAPAIENNLCKIHLKAFKNGARPSGVHTRFHEQFRTR